MRVGTQAARHRDVLDQQIGQPGSLPEHGRDQKPGIRHAAVVTSADISPIQRARLRHQEAPTTHRIDRRIQAQPGSTGEV